MSDRTPYCYKIGWSKLKIWYYGRRTAKKCHPSELWVKYFTSSKEVPKFIKLNRQPDIIKITKIFNNIDDCKIYEEKILTRVNARLNENFLNKVNSDKKLNPLQTGPCSEKRKLSISNSRKNTIKIECPHCNKKVDPGNYKLFHGEYCKYNKNIDINILKERSNKAKTSYIKQLKSGNYNKPKVISGNFICPHCNKHGTNYGAMQYHHFNNCPVYTGNHIKNIPIKVSCILCKNELDKGNFMKHILKCN